MFFMNNNSAENSLQFGNTCIQTPANLEKVLKVLHYFCSYRNLVSLEYLMHVQSEITLKECDQYKYYCL
jgi:hypothetical protein